MKRHSWLTLLLLVGLTPLLLGSNTHDRRSESEERAAWFGDMFLPHVVMGCVPASGGLTLAAVACQAYVRATATRELVFVNQVAAPIGPLSGGDGAYWLAVHRNTSTGLAGWTRQAGTHYLWQRSATVPDAPTDALLVAEITVAGGVVTVVSARHPTSPVPMQAVTVYTSQFVPVHGMTFAAIQAAIDSLPSYGGTVIVEPGTYTGSTPIEIGNGGAGVASTRAGIIVRGLTAPNWNLQYASTVLQWTGGNNPVVYIKGPLSGWGLHNLYIHGGGTASAGVFVVSGQFGDVSNLVIYGHAGNGIWSTCVPTFPGYPGVTDALKNAWRDIWVWHLPPAAPATAGVVLDSTHITCNTDFNTFYQLTVFVAGVDGWGIWLGGSDHNMFFDAHVGDDAMTRSDIHFAYDNAGSDAWPCADNFYGVGISAKGMSSSGVPAGAMCSNVIFGTSGPDIVEYLPDLPGVVTYMSRSANHNLLLVPGFTSSSAQPLGHVEVFMTPARPHGVVPMLDNIADLGLRASAEGAKRWKDLHLGGGVILPSRSTVTDTALDVTTDYYLQIFNAGGATSIPLGSAVTGCAKEFVIKNTGGFVAVLYPTLGQLIDGAADYTIAAGGAARIRSDCANWQLVGRF